jgi:eukaryotic-like serine/threonine-protein kinase
MTQSHDATHLFARLAEGDRQALDALFALVYDELREVARRHRVRWHGDHTLHTTALVHEAYLKLAQGGGWNVEGRGHFLALAAGAMRHILSNHARARGAQRRGGGLERRTFGDATLQVPAEADAELDGAARRIAALDAALQDLERRHPRRARVVECRFFGDLSVEETASAIGISPRTVKRDWAAALDALRDALSAEGAGAEASGADIRTLLSGYVASVGAGDAEDAEDAEDAGAGGDADLAPGDALGRFRVLERLGAGGMGVVYRAEDPLLGRAVALKVLPSGLVDDAAARERLTREARAASSLDHPNIAVVHDVGFVDPAPDRKGPGRPYIAMAYYDGETLRDRIQRGPLPADEAVGIAGQILEGLARAHEAGIVHRDVKPENLIVTPRGVVKILDFGVALVGDPPPGDMAAGLPGAGTAAYLSPERRRGEPADAGADLWAVAVILHELLFGVRPAPGTPPEEVPGRLARILARALAVDRAERPADAGAFLRALREATEPPRSRPEDPASSPVGILVLPFDDRQLGRADAPVAPGLAEELIARLAQVRPLRLIASASALRTRGRAGGGRATARELGVDFLLEGSLEMEGTRLRIHARLVEVASDALRWERDFQGARADLPRLSEGVARAVVDGLRIPLSEAENRALSTRPLAHPQAYDAYLRARYEAWSFTEEGLVRARRYMDAALDMVGDNALLLSTLGHITAMHLEAGIDPSGQGIEEVERLAERVLRLDPGSPRGLWLRAFVAFQRGDLATAIEAGEAAEARAPHDPDILLLLGYVHAHVGHHARARMLFERAVEVDPLTPVTQCMPGFVSVLEGRFEEALPPYRRLHRLDPESPFAAVTLGWVLAYAGREDEALSLLDHAADRHRGSPFASWAESLGQGLRGNPECALAAITPAFEAAASGSEMFARALAQCHALGGAVGPALDWLERAIELGLLDHAFLARHDRFLEAVRGEPRFEALMERVRARVDELRLARANSLGVDADDVEVVDDP